jgi:hypothetical protein
MLVGPCSKFSRGSIYHLTYYIVLLTAFILISFPGVRHTGSDPSGSLLVTESLLKHHTCKLDPYSDKPLKDRYGYKIHKKNGYIYYYFPIGTSIASIPFVALANGWGLDMYQSGSAVQILIASFIGVFTLITLIKLALIFLPPYNALLISASFWFGSSLVSTCGTALWSHNFATLFGLISIYLTINAIQQNKFESWPIISLCLFLAYLCRPTLSLLAPCLLFLFYTYNKKASIKSALLLALFVCCFAGWSMAEFNQILPDYYLPQRLSGDSHFAEALYGNLFSPARGLLVYSPFIIFTFFFTWPYSRNLYTLKRSWLLVGLFWPLIHLIVISRFPHWWAGHSFGPRLMTDVLPGIFLLTINFWPVNIKGFWKRFGALALSLSIIFALWVNSYQGLFNRYTALWNASPSIDKYPEYLFDWRYPQFLHNRNRHEARLLLHRLKNK